MAKLKLTKGELKRQRDALRQFERYLPTLQLKKQQLQMKVNEVRSQILEKEQDIAHREGVIEQWVGLLADPRIKVLAANGEVPFLSGQEEDPASPLVKWFTPSKADIERVNIAGANVPFLKEVYFEDPAYDLYETPFWMDRGIAELQDYVRELVALMVIKQRSAVLEHELRTTSQRVNLFEKVKIPEAQDNIRRIRIYLGDQQANAVGISKVAKKKLQEVSV